MTKKVLAACAGLVALLAVGGASYPVLHANRPVRVNLANGAYMTVPVISDTSAVFDLTVPEIPDGQFVSVLGWTSAAGYWEVDVDSTSIYVQWVAGENHGLRASLGQIDDATQRHIVLTVGADVSLDVDGSSTRLSGISPLPLASVVLNPVAN